MKKDSQKYFLIAACALTVFILWTLLIRFVDVGNIGPENTSVGFSTINKFVHDLTGIHMSLYHITDWLGLVPLFFVLGFALLGLTQWIRRKRLSRVDCNILALGGFYIVMMAVYIFFEIVIVNYRPGLIYGVLEPSYPSSTTMLVMCVMPTAMMQLNSRIKHNTLRWFVMCTIAAFTIFMVIGRLISGVHWCTDIIGGSILSTGLVFIYRAVIGLN